MSKPNDMQVPGNEIVSYLESVQFDQYKFTDKSVFMVQSEDKKKVNIAFSEIEKVLPRTDVDGSPFIQVNFLNKRKVLITKKLIGFKPVEVAGLDSQKIPKVVTTLDLRSIRYAIEELLDGEESYQLTLELDVLKKVYQSIMMGAEEVGFDVQQEKSWFFANMLNSKAISA